MSPLPPDDFTADEFELVSAFVDGEATPAEAAQVETSPRLQALAGRLRLIAAAMAEPLATVPDQVRSAAVSRALAAGAEAAVHSLADARARRSRARRWLPALSAAAAVLVLLALVPALLRTNKNTGSEQMATSADANEESGLAASTTGDEGAGTAAAGSSGGAPAPDASEAQYRLMSDGDLGVYDDLGVLSLEVRDRFFAALDSDAAAPTTTAPATDLSGGPPVACETAIRTEEGDGVGALRYDAAATFRDDPVGVFVFSLAAPGSAAFRLYVVDADCAVLTADDF